MKMRYKFINFVLLREIISNSEMPEWECKSNKHNQLLGYIAWYEPWKRFCLYPKPSTIFDSICMGDIIDFIGQIPETTNPA